MRRANCTADIAHSRSDRHSIWNAIKDVNIQVELLRSPHKHFLLSSYAAVALTLITARKQTNIRVRSKERRKDNVTASARSPSRIPWTYKKKNKTNKTLSCHLLNSYNLYIRVLDDTQRNSNPRPCRRSNYIHNFLHSASSSSYRWVVFRGITRTQL